VRESLAAMTRLQRLALSLYHYEKLGPEGIAEALDVAPQEVDRLLAEGTDRVNRALRRRQEEAGGDTARPRRRVS
jgi:DNA-directed RNA polymerase specialized sigma24 family protein